MQHDGQLHCFVQVWLKEALQVLVDWEALLLEHLYLLFWEWINKRLPQEVPYLVVILINTGTSSLHFKIPTRKYFTSLYKTEDFFPHFGLYSVIFTFVDREANAYCFRKFNLQLFQHCIFYLSLPLK